MPWARERLLSLGLSGLSAILRPHGLESSRPLNSIPYKLLGLFSIVAAVGLCAAVSVFRTSATLRLQTSATFMVLEGAVNCGVEARSPAPDELEEHLRRHWTKIRAKLLAGTYVPSPVKRVLKLIGRYLRWGAMIEGALVRSEAQPNQPLMVNLKKLCAEQRVVSGVHQVFGELYREVGFGKLMGARRKAAERNLFHTVMGRLANPQSKRATVAALEQDFGVHLNLQSVYRLMDSIDQKVIEKAKRKACEAANGLLRHPVQLLFYDCTTLYFESFTEDDLKKNGYSKDMKFNQPQVVVGLLATEEGLPVDYEVYPGNQFEGGTLEPAINNIRERYDLQRVVFTADSAMLGKDILALLDQLEVPYIIAARLKNLTAAWTRKVLDRDEYQPGESGAPYQRIREWDYGDGCRLIVTYSQKRADKDRHDRERAVEKLRAKIAKSESPASLISNYGYKRYLRIKGDSKIVLEEKKLEQAARWDGLHGVIISAAELSASQAIEHYKKLWQIEDCFRVAKHDLRIRPIFHWTPARVRAHILICFLALVCIRSLAYRVQLRFESISPARIVRTLNSVQASILRDTTTNCRYVLPSRISEDARKLYTTMALKPDSTPYEIPKTDSALRRKSPK